MKKANANKLFEINVICPECSSYFDLIQCGIGEEDIEYNLNSQEDINLDITCPVCEKTFIIETIYGG